MIRNPELRSSVTIIVAASDSLHKDRADYVCDGVDDQVEIQAAIDALPSGGGTVVLLEGDFSISDTIQLVDNMALIGNNGTKLTLIDTGPHRPILSIDGKTNVTIDRLHLDGNKAGQSSPGLWHEGIDMVGAWSNVWVKNCFIENCADSGIDIDGGSNAIIESCIIKNCNGYAIHISQQNPQRITVRSVHSEGNGITRTCAAFDVYNDAGTAGDYCSFEQCISKDDYMGFYISGTYNSIIDCKIINATYQGITSSSTGDHLSIHDVLITGGCSNGAIDTLLTDTIVSGCNIYDCGGRGISVKGCSVVVGNKIYSPGTYGIYLNGTYCVANGNLVDGSIYPGIYSASNYTNINGNTICNMVGSSQFGICCEGSYSVINNNVLHNNVGSGCGGIKILGDFCTIAANVLTANGSGGGILVNGVDESNITNNIIKSTAGRGLDCVTLTNSIISGNQIKNNATYGLNLDSNSTNNIVKINTMLSNSAGNLRDLATGNLIYDKYSDLFMDALAVSATHVRSNEDLSEGIPNTFTIDAQPDIPRTLSGHFDAHAQITAYTIDIVGVDAKGNSVTEEITEADGWDWETSNAFATITSIIMSARTGTGAGDTMDIGITDVLGLSNIIYATGDVYKIKKNNANVAVVAGDVNFYYSTYDMHTIGLAATDDFTIWYKSNLNIIS